MNRAAVCLAFAALAAVPAGAVICDIDQKPAATLLLPYFEVDLGNPAGITTLLSVNNAFSDEQLAKVEIWTDLGVPVGGFDVYLKGFDVQSMNMRDILNCVLPQTAPPPGSPHSASCAGGLPPPPGLCSTSNLHNALTGKFSSFLNGCGGLDHGDNVARGYVTVDVVNECSTQFQGSPGYFGAGGTGVPSNHNAIWGDYFFINPSQNYAAGQTLVHIEASSSNAETSVAGQYTFYGKFDGWNASDNREPLDTVFGARFLNGGAFSGGTNLIVWRDSKVQQNAFKCGTTPPWYPLGQEAIFVFDENGNSASLGAVKPFPAVTQRVKVGGAQLPVPYSFGWMILGLSTSVAQAGSNPPEDPTRAQAWVTVEMDAAGKFSVGYEAIQYDSACTGVVASP